MTDAGAGGAMLLFVFVFLPLFAGGLWLVLWLLGRGR